MAVLRLLLAAALLLLCACDPPRSTPVVQEAMVATAEPTVQPEALATPRFEDLSAAEHLAAARALIQAGDSPKGTEPVQAAATLDSSSEGFPEARRHLAAIPKSALEAKSAPALFNEIARRDAVISANRIALAHVVAANEIVRATDEPEVVTDAAATAQAIISAAGKFPEALRHLSAVSSTSPFAARATGLRAEIQERQKAISALRVIFPPPSERANRLRQPSTPPLLAPPRRVVSEVPTYQVPPSAVVPAPGCQENGSCYGDISPLTGMPRTVEVHGYTRKDGTYVRGHFRGAPRR